MTKMSAVVLTHFCRAIRYLEANPNAPRPGQENPEEWFETDNQRELNQIFAGQSKMFDALRDIQRKMDEIVGRQERTLGLMSSVQSNQGEPLRIHVVHSYRAVLKVFLVFFCSAKSRRRRSAR